MATDHSTGQQPTRSPTYDALRAWRTPKAFMEANPFLGDTPDTTMKNLAALVAVVQALSQIECDELPYPAEDGIQLILVLVRDAFGKQCLVCKDAWNVGRRAATGKESPSAHGHLTMPEPLPYHESLTVAREVLGDAERPMEEDSGEFLYKLPAFLDAVLQVLMDMGRFDRFGDDNLSVAMRALAAATVHLPDAVKQSIPEPEVMAEAMRILEQKRKDREAPEVSRD